MPLRPEVTRAPLESYLDTHLGAMTPLVFHSFIPLSASYIAKAGIRRPDILAALDSVDSQHQVVVAKYVTSELTREAMITLASDTLRSLDIPELLIRQHKLVAFSEPRILPRRHPQTLAIHANGVFTPEDRQPVRSAVYQASQSPDIQCNTLLAHQLMTKRASDIAHPGALLRHIPSGHELFPNHLQLGIANLLSHGTLRPLVHHGAVRASDIDKFYRRAAFWLTETALAATKISKVPQVTLFPTQAAQWENPRDTAPSPYALFHIGTGFVVYLSRYKETTKTQLYLGGKESLIKQYYELVRESLFASMARIGNADRLTDIERTYKQGERYIHAPTLEEYIAQMCVAPIKGALDICKTSHPAGHAGLRAIAESCLSLFSALNTPNTYPSTGSTLQTFLAVQQDLIRNGATMHTPTSQALATEFS